MLLRERGGGIVVASSFPFWHTVVFPSVTGPSFRAHSVTTVTLSEREREPIETDQILYKTLATSSYFDMAETLTFLDEDVPIADRDWSRRCFVVVQPFELLRNGGKMFISSYSDPQNIRSTAQSSFLVNCGEYETCRPITRRSEHVTKLSRGF